MPVKDMVDKELKYHVSGLATISSTGHINLNPRNNQGLFINLWHGNQIDPRFYLEILQCNMYGKIELEPGLSEILREIWNHRIDHDDIDSTSLMILHRFDIISHEFFLRKLMANTTGSPLNFNDPVSSALRDAYINTHDDELAEMVKDWVLGSAEMQTGMSRLVSNNSSMFHVAVQQRDRDSINATT